MALLEVKDLHVSYGAIKAVRGVSFYMDRGEIVTLIGSNGAGKSTTMNAIMGGIKSESGNITFEGSDITNIKPHLINRKGIAISPEGRQVFPRFNVKQNLLMGAYSINDKKIIEDGYERVMELFPRLKEREKQAAGNLSGGEQQMLAVARALISNPKLIIMDEPSLGLAPIPVQEIFELIEKINAEGTSVLLVEQNARMALKISDRGYVMENGKIVLTDTGKALAENDVVRQAYLGGRQEGK